jgi:predicted metal-dependent hydrolase
MKRSSSHSLQYHGTSFPYTLHRKRDQKHRYIRIKDGKVIVTAAYMTPLYTIENFVKEKADWISKHLKKTNDKYDLVGHDATICWLGDKYSFTIEKSKKNYLLVEADMARFFLNEAPTHFLLLHTLQNHYKKHAPEHILPKVEAWSLTMGLVPAKVSFRRAKTRWGSCSSRDTLSLNTYLMMLPDHLIDYIIVHELAHIRHKNHSKKFWSLTQKYIPDWKSRRKELRTYERYMN